MRKEHRYLKVVGTDLYLICLIYRFQFIIVFICKCGTADSDVEAYLINYTEQR